MSPAFPVLLMNRYVPSRKVQERARCVTIPTLPYCLSCQKLSPIIKIILSTCCMDDNCKKKIVIVKKHIQQKNYAAALDELQVMVYKYAKLYQIHLMAGLCYKNLKKLYEAEKAYLQVLDLKPDESNAMKELCDIYNERGDIVKSTKYMEMNANLLKLTDNRKYRETIIKLIRLYEQDDNLEKIDPIFQQYVADQQKIGEDFVGVAGAYFRVGVKNQCFNLQKFGKMGIRGDKTRNIIPSARQGLNHLLIDVYNYLQAISKQYQLSQKNISDSLVHMKILFPQAPCLLMLLLFNQYCIGQLEYSSMIMEQVYKFLQSFFDKVDNGYLNLEYTEPQMFTVCMILSRQYLAFFKEFFALDDLLLPYFNKLLQKQAELKLELVREDYNKKINSFILKQSRQLYSQSKFSNIQVKLEDLKERILNLQNSFLEQVIAKIAINCFTSYDKINDIKNLLKLRIKNLAPTDSAPHLYKYYYEYVFKIAKVFKSLDQQIPLIQIHNYIATHDPKDLKFYLQNIWFEFSMLLRTDQQEKQQAFALEAINKIRACFLELQQSLKSGALRKIMLLKIFTKDLDVGQEIQQVLELERCFQNLQFAGFYYYFIKDYKKALSVLKEAFGLNQLHYHTNRLLFLVLIKVGQEKEAINFLERIHEGFTSVFWINYLIGISKINQRKYIEAEVYMNSALQSYQASSSGKFRFSYERVKDIGSFTFLYLVQQNEYSIFFDQLIFPQQVVYGEFKLASNLYFTHDSKRNKINLFMKEAQLLKILGRTKTSLNYLAQAYVQSSEIKIQQSSQLTLIIEICLMKKQYATLLFYMRQFKESESVLYESFILSNWLNKRGKEDNNHYLSLIQKIDNEIKALSFQISVDRLAMMMKFESHELIEDYISVFKTRIEYPSKPSLNFYKNKYQFHILQYMHDRHSLSQLTQAITDFLKYFSLQLGERLTLQFQNRLFELSQEQRRSVREGLEDFYIVGYISGQQGVKSDEVLQMIQLFPRSSIFYIIYGMCSKDLKLKTASFLKCIQMDKESTVSIDILASLYLKQKNYLAAAKLFLKSLQLNILNSKCYLGLAICLFCLIARAIQDKQDEQVDIVKKCLIRINSYMEYLRISDPSENYHLLNFLKLLLAEEKNDNFQIKLILQSSQRACHKYRNSLLSQLLQEAARQWKDYNIWKNEDQLKIVTNYIGNTLHVKETELQPIAIKLADRLRDKLMQMHACKEDIGKQLLVKHVQRQLNELAIGLNLAIKAERFNQSIFAKYVAIIHEIQGMVGSWSITIGELNILKYKIKGYFYDYIYKQTPSSQQKTIVQQIFPQVAYYEYISKYHQKINNLQREISRRMLLDPANEEIRKIYSGYLISRKNLHVRKGKLSYKLELLNTMNQNMINDRDCYKKVYLLYRDPTALTMYLQHCWNDCALKDMPRLTTLLKYIVHIQSKEQVKLNGVLLQKLMRLKLQILGYCKYHFKTDPLSIQLNQFQQQKLRKIILVNQIMDYSSKKDKMLQQKLKQLKQLFKNNADEFDWWILLSLFSFVSTTFKTNKQYEGLLEQIANKSAHANVEGYLLILRLLSAFDRQIQTEQDLVEQIVSVSELGIAAQDKINPNTEVIIQCSKCLLSGSYDEIQNELGRAAQSHKVVTYSDSILINFYEVIRLYKSAESNPNGEGVIQGFIYMTDCMISLVKEPHLKGFFLSLKGIVHSLATVQGTTKDRNIKQAILYSPMAAKSLLGVQ